MQISNILFFSFVRIYYSDFKKGLVITAFEMPEIYYFFIIWQYKFYYACSANTSPCTAIFITYSDKKYPVKHTNSYMIENFRDCLPFNIYCHPVEETFGQAFCKLAMKYIFFYTYKIIFAPLIWLFLLRTFILNNEW